MKKDDHPWNQGFRQPSVIPDLIRDPGGQHGDIFLRSRRCAISSPRYFVAPLFRRPAISPLRYFAAVLFRRCAISDQVRDDVFSLWYALSCLDESKKLKGRHQFSLLQNLNTGGA